MKKVLIVDDSPLICRLLEKAIASFPEFVPVGRAADGVEALTLIEKLEPDLCPLDVNMPAMDGLSLLKKLTVRKPLPSLNYCLVQGGNEGRSKTRHYMSCE